ncbi:Mitogen-activated protein kinase 10 [Platanthera guangdongensis]|uniref:Mitogen-activated protein kinase 10 n=1 Tax=Platanthera guangdongensis TaxID=2320717 RepID=A0ABR2M2S5_9ASPA
MPKPKKELTLITAVTHFAYTFMMFTLLSAVDQFKKQFAHLEEHYGNGARVPPLERQHASLPRHCVCRSENTAHNSDDTVLEFSKCSINEDDQPKPQHENGIAPVTSFPLQSSQKDQGATFRSGRARGSMLRQNNGPDPSEQRRTAYSSSNCAYPRRNPSNKSEPGEEGRNPGSYSSEQHKQQPYLSRKAAAAHAGPSSQW